MRGWWCSILEELRKAVNPRHFPRKFQNVLGIGESMYNYPISSSLHLHFLLQLHLIKPKKRSLVICNIEHSFSDTIFLFLPEPLTQMLKRIHPYTPQRMVFNPNTKNLKLVFNLHTVIISQDPPKWRTVLVSTFSTGKSLSKRWYGCPPLFPYHSHIIYIQKHILVKWKYSWDGKIWLHLPQDVFKVLGGLLHRVCMNAFIGCDYNLFIFWEALDLLLHIAVFIRAPVVASTNNKNERNNQYIIYEYKITSFSTSIPTWMIKLIIWLIKLGYVLYKSIWLIFQLNLSNYLIKNKFKMS